MNNPRILHWHKTWFWFTFVFACLLFGYGLLSSVVHLHFLDLMRWAVGLCVWYVGWVVVSRRFFGPDSINRSFGYLREVFRR